VSGTRGDTKRSSIALERSRVRVCFLVNQRLVFIWYAIASVITFCILWTTLLQNPTGQVWIGKSSSGGGAHHSIMPMQQQLLRLASHQQLSWSNRLYQTTRRSLGGLISVGAFYLFLLWLSI